MTALLRVRQHPPEQHLLETRSPEIHKRPGQRIALLDAPPGRSFWSTVLVA